jgi:hypothetical protein
MDKERTLAGSGGQGQAGQSCHYATIETQKPQLTAALPSQGCMSTAFLAFDGVCFLGDIAMRPPAPRSARQAALLSARLDCGFLLACGHHEQDHEQALTALLEGGWGSCVNAFCSPQGRVGGT